MCFQEHVDSEGGGVQSSEKFLRRNTGLSTAHFVVFLFCFSSDATYAVYKAKPGFSHYMVFIQYELSTIQANIVQTRLARLLKKKNKQERMLVIEAEVVQVHELNRRTLSHLG